MLCDKMTIIFYFDLSKVFMVRKQVVLFQKCLIGYLFFAAIKIKESQIFQFCISDDKISFRDIFLTNYPDFVVLKH